MLGAWKMLPYFSMKQRKFKIIWLCEISLSQKWYLACKYNFAAVSGELHELACAMWKDGEKNPGHSQFKVLSEEKYDS